MIDKKRKKITVSANDSGNSREKIEKVTEVAVKTFKKAIKELEKH